METQSSIKCNGGSVPTLVCPNVDYLAPEVFEEGCGISYTHRVDCQAIIVLMELICSKASYPLFSMAYWKSQKHCNIFANLEKFGASVQKYCNTSDIIKKMILRRLNCSKIHFSPKSCKVMSDFFSNRLQFEWFNRKKITEAATKKFVNDLRRDCYFSAVVQNFNFSFIKNLKRNN